MAKQTSTTNEEPAIEDGGKIEPRPVAVPPEGKRFFNVSWKGSPEPRRVTAADENEAWALYCDGNKVWPSPKSRTVVEVDGNGNAIEPKPVEPKK